MQVVVSPPLPVNAILERSDDALRGGRPTIFVGTCDERAVTLGFAQKEGTAEEARAKELGIAVLRRSSGGVGLLHETGDVFWSVVLPRESPHVGRDFINAYPRLGSGMTRFLREKGLDASWEKTPSLSKNYCTLTGRGYVLSSGGRVLGGASQHLAGGYILHHGTVSCSLDREFISAVFGLDTSISWGALTCLNEQHIQLAQADMEHLAASLRDALV